MLRSAGAHPVLQWPPLIPIADVFEVLCANVRTLAAISGCPSSHKIVSCSLRHSARANAAMQPSMAEDLLPATVDLTCHTFTSAPPSNLQQADVVQTLQQNLWYCDLPASIVPSHSICRMRWRRPWTSSKRSSQRSPSVRTCRCCGPTVTTPPTR